MQRLLAGPCLTTQALDQPKATIIQQMNTVGNVNIALHTISSSFALAPNAAARDLSHQSSNITLIQLLGTLGAIGGLVAVRMASVQLAPILHIDTSSITVALLACYLVCLWIYVLRKWDKNQKSIPDMAADRRKVLESFDDLKLHAKKSFPGIYDGLLDVRKVMVRVLSGKDDSTYPRLGSMLMSFLNSRELAELSQGDLVLKAISAGLEHALNKSLAATVVQASENASRQAVDGRYV